MITYVPFDMRDHYSGVLTLKLCPQDQRELKAMFGMTPSVGLDYSLKVSSKVYVIHDESTGVIKGVFGVAPSVLPSNKLVGVPWMVSDGCLRRVPITLIKHSVLHVCQWLHEFKTLENFTDVTNEASIKFLAHIGFTVDLARTYTFHDPSVHFVKFRKEIL